ncbi:MAG: COX15/CtaA family protein [Bdellovibrionales bacterium]
MTINITKNNDHKNVVTWLYTCCTLVLIIVIVGAITRLTDSGLSMVEWRPLMGTLPPLTDAEWQRVYDLYKASPEFEQKHFWMDLNDFKQIFFWEWFHRFLGRIIGLAFALPLLWFAIKKQIPQGYGLKFIGLLCLGGCQGLMGWYMVKSGLVDEPYVSHYRLAAHLSLAFLVFSLLLWCALSIRANYGKGIAKLYTHSWVALGILIVTIFWGAYVAGLNAGLIYNESFPKMGGQWIPSDIAQYQPYWINFFETPSGVQFVHRWLAMITVIGILSLVIHAYKTGVRHWCLSALAIMVSIQFGLGLATLISNVYIPVAVLHQTGALILLGLLIVNLRLYKPT